MRTRWFLGIDLGTGSCKSVVVDENARILGFGSGDYRSDSVQSKWREQDPNAMVDGMVRSVRAAVSKAAVSAKDCGGFSLGSALHGILAVDYEGNPLTGVITWADDRASQEAQSVRETGDVGAIYGETGCPVHWMYPLYKIMWLRDKQPDVFRKTDRFVSAKEFIIRRLIGSYCVDYSLAAGSGLLDTHRLAWSDRALGMIGIDADRLSTVCRPGETFTSIDPELAGAMGIPSDTPFTLGSSDAANSNLGAGAVHAWQSTCMIGTSGALRIIAPRPILDPRRRSWCYVVDEGKWLVGGAINNGGVALSWLQDMLNSATVSIPGGPTVAFDDLDRLAESAGCGAQGVICLPLFAGERSPNWDMNARALFFGMTLQHDARHLSRALLEGVAFRMRSLNQILCELSVDIRQVRASGGFTRSSLWLQIVSDVLNQELVVPAWGETSSLGAAFWAMLETGALSSFEQIEACVALSGTHRPVPERAAVYDRQFEIYRMLYDAVRPSFAPIAAFQKQLGLG